MNKKGDDKTLGMIFGLFVLLIVAFVILNMFFKWVDIFGTQSKKMMTDAEKKAVWEKNQVDCNLACSQIQDENSAIEFCAKYKSIDMNGDQKTFKQKGSYGKYDFCEEMIPCFILVNENDCTYTGGQCQALLKEYRGSTYYKKLSSPDGTGGCGLDPASPNNWITLFKFNEAAP